MSDNNDATKKEVDPELDDLLDREGSEVPQNMWSEEFVKEAAAQFESSMAALLGSFSGVPGLCRDIPNAAEPEF
ncbi:hypothetical protein MSG28_015318 [Choristoneura fumiferana]|uniref:Uncharacterized protein n=1 Tax=Choristoneura fumiferana TaxID=7141 RepID=A0ACC0K9Y3_CHOFU|nr:hypothetical protein MSG28_015318 [Choristoneura fumiferana]